MGTSLQIILVLGILALNIFISYFNARSVGQVWDERNAHGTFMWALIWSGFIQAVLGFSMPIIGVLLGGLYLLGKLSPKAVEAGLSLWYLTAIIPLLGTGMIITIHSWIETYRDRSWTNIGITAYNTYAMASNVYSAATNIGPMFGKVMEFFSSDDEDNNSIKALVGAVVVMSFVGGYFLAAAVRDKYRGTLPAPVAQTATA
ncbi:MAG: hypothetical protein EOP83_15965 [Verrucomicrobiaceae bacterium]|nr:MAG: hypothetical protein EOP83_15965 [Verrucomicrobiaceae bacterium]